MCAQVLGVTGVISNLISSQTYSSPPPSLPSSVAVVSLLHHIPSIKNLHGVKCSVRYEVEEADPLFRRCSPDQKATMMALFSKIYSLVINNICLNAVRLLVSVVAYGPDLPKFYFGPVFTLGGKLISTFLSGIFSVNGTAADAFTKAPI